MMAYQETWPSPTAVNRVRDEETLEKCRAIRKERAGQTTVPLYLEEVATLWKTPHGMGNLDASGKHGGSGDGEFAKQVTQWPTPDANAINDGESAESWRKRQERLKVTAKNGNGAGVPLAIAAQELWTTPQAHDSAGGSPDRVRRKGTEHGCANLADDVTKWPTPDASMASGGRQSAEPLATKRESGTKKAITLNDAAQSGIWDE